MTTTGCGEVTVVCVGSVVSAGAVADAMAIATRSSQSTASHDHHQRCHDQRTVNTI